MMANAGSLRGWLRAAVVMSLLYWAAPVAGADAPEAPVFRSRDSQFAFLQPIRPAPNAAIRSVDGAPLDLAELRGRVVVLNFWATWCLPCAYEMPSLDRLAASVDPARLRIVAVAIDRDGATTVAPFARSHGLAHLDVGLDPGQSLGTLDVDRAASSLPLWRLPITYLIDKRGNVIGYLTGAADWDSSAARAFLNYFLQPD